MFEAFFMRNNKVTGTTSLPGLWEESGIVYGAVFFLFLKRPDGFPCFRVGNVFYIAWHGDVDTGFSGGREARASGGLSERMS